MARNRVTIYDIAREAGVSPATVSRILKGSSVVSGPCQQADSQIQFSSQRCGTGAFGDTYQDDRHGHGRYRKSILQQRIFRML